MSKPKSTLWKHLVCGLAIVAVILLLIGELPRMSYTQTNAGPKRAPLNPEFVNYMKSRARGMVTPTTPDGHSLGLIPSPHFIPRSAARPGRRKSYELLPATYDLRTQNKLTPIRDQGYCGSCWAFATYGALESYLMPAEPADYSENDLIQNSGFSFGSCEGGTWEMAMAYLAR